MKDYEPIRISDLSWPLKLAVIGGAYGFLAMCIMVVGIAYTLLKISMG